ncbi:putative bifunctional diguanylate cyclase/phosphodiesterase [Azospira restricta]|uniref:EAL domain-containing protein n=1 Tax=Azospira restricta TaxID=404405 RepID=A0A974SPH0_9RHOO|nr:EAL domain-containing protein [Azospira restricta]QRJ64088.1 EAL domain-containing protein [Azospira restricta]
MMRDDHSPHSPRISYRLLFASAMAAGAALLLAVVLLVIVEFFTLRSALLEDSRVKAAVVADNLSAALVFRDSQTAAEIVGSLRASPIVLGAVLVDQDGARLAAYPPDFAEAVPAVGELGDSDHRFRTSRLELVAPVTHQGALLGRVYVVISMSSVERRLGIYALSSAAVAAIALLLAVGLLSRVRQSVRQAEQNLRHLAHVDPVTGLANRNAFNERLEFAIDEAASFDENVAMLLLDLDNFKQVNDTLGHQAGDELLRMVAQRILRSLRRDDIVARLGGDEFAVILKGLSARSEATQVCAKLIESIGQPFPIEGQDFFVTASIGVAFFPEDAEDSRTLIRNADTAMYQAKVAGKNVFELFVPAMNLNVKKRVSLESSLRGALQGGELALHYQPKVDLMRRRVLGFEALLRWHSPEHGNVSPADFIPIAEDSGLIVPIGEWVITQALNDLRRWNDGRRDKLHVAVNLSTRQLRVDDITRRIAQLIADCAVPADWLELELTESMVMENVHAQIETFQQLQALGVKLAIDDFGTGYSSMSYLKRLPIDTLKIDRSFVGDLPKDQNDLAIATAIIALAHSLGLTVIAEGIETTAQAEALLNLGCDLGQGYLFARPMPAAQVAQYLAANA